MMDLWIAEQNNSGGGYIGAEFVVAVAETEEEAIKKMIDHSFSFDPDADFCPCCGERWDIPWKIELDLLIGKLARRGTLAKTEIVLPDGKVVKTDNPNAVRDILSEYVK